MKIGILSHGPTTGLAAVYGRQWAHLPGLLSDLNMPAPEELREFIRQYHRKIPQLNEKLMEAIHREQYAKHLHPVSESFFLPPVPAHPRLQTARGNSALFSRCLRSELPKQPVLEIRTNFNLVGHDAHFELKGPGGWNYEIVLVIGQDARWIPKDKAYDHVFGYTSMLDHAGGDPNRNPYKNNGAFSVPPNEKKFIDYAFEGNWNNSVRVPVALGPVIVTRDEVEDPHDMLLRETETGRLVSVVHTGAVLFTFPEILEYLSAMMTLEAGDMLSSGSIGYDSYPTPETRLPDGAFYQGETDKLPPLKLNVADCRSFNERKDA